MPVTLAQAKVGMADKVDQKIIDEFRRSSLLLDRLTFDDAVSPGTGGSTLTYSYIKLKSPAVANFRKINTEYTPQEADREQAYANCKIFGGSAQVDRVIQNTSGAVNEMAFQLQEKVLGARNLFHYTVINGDSVSNGDEFDGLDVMVTGTSTEYITNTIDLSDSSALDANHKYFADMVDEFLSGFASKPDIIMGNSKLITKIKAVARRNGYYTRSEDAFGRSVSEYDGIPLLDMGEYWNGTNSVPCVGTDASGFTSLYAVCLGLDAFHAASPAGEKIIRTYLPDMTKPDAVKKVECEMVACVVLKNTLKAGAFRKIKVV